MDHIGESSEKDGPGNPAAANAPTRTPIIRMTMSQQTAAAGQPPQAEHGPREDEPEHSDKAAEDGASGESGEDSGLAPTGVPSTASDPQPSVGAPASNVVSPGPALATVAHSPATHDATPAILLSQHSTHRQPPSLMPTQPSMTMQGKSGPVSPTYGGGMRSPLYPAAAAAALPANPISGPPTPNPLQYVVSPSASTISASSSTTSFLAHQAQSHSAQAHSSNQPIVQRMALNDAFSYLDKVKAEFSGQPEIYNKFLHVMREFKANSIDAAGVIIRVVQLFKGHRDLILGFNAFLPKTHHIDPSVAESGELPSNFILAAQQQQQQQQQQSAHLALQQVGHVGRPTSNWSPAFAGGSLPLPGRPPAGQPGAAQVRPIPISSQPQASPQSVDKDQPLPTGPNAALKKSSNAQFTRAIAYVKKVRQRFADDPESYRTFLNALHSFHKDQRSVAEVYAQVQRLFKEHADLMEDFMQFLPENNAEGSGNGGNDAISAASIRSRLPPMGKFSPEPSDKRDQDLDHGQHQHQQLQSNQVKRSKRRHPIDSVATGSHSSSSTTTTTQLAGKAARAPHQPPPAITKTAEEVDFFEKVKKHLGSRQSYAEFLKCLNLYSQNILKMPELINCMSSFIGGNEDLFSWFKRYIGYSLNAGLAGEHDASFEQQSSLFIHGPHDLPPVNLSACKRQGSYRMLPSSSKLAPSSGRTELCKEVLNDVMISCPTFESEDSTFVSSKKNAFEEALFRCEDERFELDLLIDGNRATISILEPLNKMLSDAKAHSSGLVLDPKLNGSSAMIYKRCIKRIYGEKGDEVYEALQRNPAATLPIVLKRLKQKDEEWQKARRDWQRVWREVHVRNFYRSLDYQSIDFKQTDRRSSSTKNLLQELEALAEERRKAGQSAKHPLQVIDLPAANVCDAYNLLMVSLKHSGSISSSDRKPVRDMLMRILPCFFKLALRTKRTADGSEPGAEHSAERDQGDDEDEAPAECYADDLPDRSYYLNGTLYGMVRMFATVVERLNKMKLLSANADASASSAKQNVVAQFLDLSIQDGTEPEDQQGLAANGDMYQALLRLLRKLLSGDTDSSLFEEQARFMFGLDAYVMFTVDRLLHSILRQCHSLLPGVSESDNGEQLVRLLEDSRRLPEYTCRMSAEALLSGPKDRLVKVQTSRRQQLLLVSLIDSNQLIMDSNAATPEQKWSAYVDSFIRLDVNPLYANGSGRGVFLRRSLNKTSTVEPVVLYNLECKICVNTYKLFYVEHTEDFLFRPVAAKPATAKVPKPSRFNALFKY